MMLVRDLLNLLNSEDINGDLEVVSMTKNGIYSLDDNDFYVGFISGGKVEHFILEVPDEDEEDEN